MATIFKRCGKGNWVIQWYDALGKRQTKSSRTTDHAAATRIANKIEADVQLRVSGVIDPRLDRIAQQAARPISEHLDEFGAAMRASSGIGHIDDTRRMIERLCDHAGWTILRDIDADGANRYAEHLISLGRAARTVNAQLTAVKALTTWAVRTARLSHDPLATVEKPGAESDRRVIRRYLKHDEYQWLDSVTRRAGDSHGMTGYERALVYAVAIQSGLRAGEIRKLTRGKLHLTGDQPFILAAAKTTKNKKQAQQYVTAELAAELLALVGRKLGGALVFNLPSEHDLASMLRCDLAAARDIWLSTFRQPQKRIEADASDFLRPLDSEGETLDFHALRHTCASWLIASGADVKTVQSVMRHSDIRLTMDRYGHLFPGVEADAISRLGEAFGRPELIRATGTTGNGPDSNENSDSGALHWAQHSGCDSVQNGAKRNESSLNDQENRLHTQTPQNIEKTAFYPRKTMMEEKKASPGFEPGNSGFAIRLETNENIGSNPTALHRAQHSFQKWAVLLVDSKGQILEKIATDQGYAGAVATAANWQQGRNRGNVVVVVPELAIEPLTGNC